jgi:hypothetical protein
MKACTKCGVVKALDAFNRRSGTRDGHRPDCRACQSTANAERYRNDPGRFKAAAEAYAKDHPEKVRASKAARYVAHRSERLAQIKAFYEVRPDRKQEKYAYRARYAKAHPEKEKAWSRTYRRRYPERNAEKTARREAAKLRATPAWANLELVAAFYVMAEAFTKSTGVPHHVDHREPLKGKHVCGLHNEFNLQVLPAKVNVSKGNRPSDVVGVR